MTPRAYRRRWCGLIRKNRPRIEVSAETLFGRVYAPAGAVFDARRLTLASGVVPQVNLDERARPRDGPGTGFARAPVRLALQGPTEQPARAFQPVEAYAGAGGQPQGTWRLIPRMSAERERARAFGRLEDGLRQASDWYLWGLYLSERQWGTVREDYSDQGDAWDYFPHDHARSRAYRWGEDGLAGFSDIEQRLCLSLALWNGRDPILKERAFGLTGEQGNHGEDVKEYWWYLDSVPSHAWNRWRYHYPQVAFPYEQLERENARRTRADPEYELVDTGAFDGDRYWVIEVTYAKADPHTLLMNLEVTNAGPDAAELHLLPTLWFRNTWAWDKGTLSPLNRADRARPGGDAAPFSWASGARRFSRPRRHRPRASFLRQRDQFPAAVRRPVQDCLPKGWDKRLRDGGESDGQPRPSGQ